MQSKILFFFLLIFLCSPRINGQNNGKIQLVDDPNLVNHTTNFWRFSKDYQKIFSANTSSNKKEIFIWDFKRQHQIRKHIVDLSLIHI